MAQDHLVCKARDFLILDRIKDRPIRFYISPSFFSWITYWYCQEDGVSVLPPALIIVVTNRLDYLAFISVLLSSIEKIPFSWVILLPDSVQLIKV